VRISEKVKREGCKVAFTISALRVEPLRATAPFYKV